MAKSNNSKKYIEHWAIGCSCTPCVADYISSVSEILHRDYPKENLRAFDKIYAWDADRYENKKYGNQSSETVDLVFGLDYGQILMVEAKLSVQNVENIKGEVEAKIKHTREYVVSKKVRGAQIRINPININGEKITMIKYISAFLYHLSSCIINLSLPNTVIDELCRTNIYFTSQL